MIFCVISPSSLLPDKDWQRAYIDIVLAGGAHVSEILANARIMHSHSPEARSTEQNAAKQRRSLTCWSLGRRHDAVLTDHALIAIVSLTGDVCRAMIGDQRVVTIWLHHDASRFPAPSSLSTLICFTVSVTIDSRIEWMHQYRANNFARRSPPFQEPFAGPLVGSNRQLDIVRLQVPHHSTEAAQTIELVKDQPNHTWTKRLRRGIGGVVCVKWEAEHRKTVV